jgi:TonB family protein
MTVRPRILNDAEIVRTMEQQYPRVLRDSGIGGTVTIHFYVDETGRVQRTEISRSSGQALLDAAALSVAGIYRFSPAQNRDQVVPVWVEFPITFRVGAATTAVAPIQNVSFDLEEARTRQPELQVRSPAVSSAPESSPRFTPMAEAPQILNAGEIQRALEGAYPAELRDRGVGGTVLLHFYVEANGRVARALVNETSGHPQLDQAALRIASTYRFTPARNRGESVPVWILLPITFRLVQD